MKWLADHGSEWVKVCAEPGDLIVWDSRVPHYNLPPEGKNDRLAVYTCFMPVNEASEEDLVRKKGAFEGKLHCRLLCCLFALCWLWTDWSS